ncbi:YheC/YheD family protein [Paenibacillus sp. FSL R5-0887]|uniref:Endospore coat-associated protein n=1 Tax=Paenibacillus odorifer TaxID=189426 RepID=A0ABX3GJW5_9BACL|nr:YheC/YheD family protein [Paenibacillus odorifer]OMC77848.1 endospore coat-associated protein [Paenibacillus odorifer]OMD18388.1 endospore coat-associated protein [Paenibacillus odorifer]OMD80132.1 endospore coat-associated protein [Paenibacillus odorifer]OMD94408.1 endospore coat-associated protein [Paenibacillus odorifer]OME04055.1 endospore coat-associated protein [Paenibacillus odorifer]
MPEPVLGILTLYINEAKQLEEKAVYRRMIVEGKRIGLDVFVFTPMDVHPSKEQIHALVFDPKSGKWSRKWRSFPNMIYDRCRIQRSSRFQQLLRFRERYNHLLFLNRPLRNKWTIHQTFSQKSRFRQHMPETLLYQSSADLRRMLKTNSVVYIKPANGTGGRGILRIEKMKDGRGVYDIQGRRQDRRIIPTRKVSSTRLDSIVRQWCIGGRFLIQQGIPLRLPGGRFHDYRMLVQKNGQGVWELTGMAARVGAARSVTSNLHGGGHAVRAETLLKEWLGSQDKTDKVMKTAERLGLDAAAFLEESYGALCELALDLAIDREGKIYVLEVNPKPAREVFARSGDGTTYRKALIRPLEYALWLYNNKGTPSTAKTTEE